MAYSLRRTHRALSWSFSDMYNLRAAVELARGLQISPGARVSPVAAREEPQKGARVRVCTQRRCAQPLVRIRAGHAVVRPSTRRVLSAPALGSD
jgi:hypothetical protein